MKPKFKVWEKVKLPYDIYCTILSVIKYNTWYVYYTYQWCAMESRIEKCTEQELSDYFLN